jgi:hypothetical protein
LPNHCPRIARQKQGRKTTVLVIPRTKGESIVIGDEIVVTVIEVQEDEVQLTVERLPGSTKDGADDVDAVQQEDRVRKRPR